MRRWIVALGAVALLALVALPWLGWDVKGAASAGPVVTRPIESLPEEVAGPTAAASDARRERAQPRANDDDAAQIEPETRASEPEAGNRLSITVLGPDGAAWALGEVRLRAPRNLFATPPKSALSAAPGAKFRITGGTGPRGIYTLLMTDERGRLEASGLEPGLAFELAVVDPLGGAGVERACPGMGPQEQREVLLTLGRAPRTLRGRCVDEAGAPLEGVMVMLQAGDLGRGTRSDAQGHFESARLFVTELDVVASLKPLMSARLEHVDPADGEVTLTLRRGRSLQVDLRDTLGRAVRIGSLTARLPGTDQSWAGYSGEEEFRKVEGLPFEPLTLEYSLDGVSFEMDVDALGEALRFEVPALGLLEVRVGKLTAETDENFLLQVRSLDDPARELRSHSVFPTGKSFVSSPLWPGRYELQLRTWRNNAPDGVPAREDYGSPLTVEVVAGVTTSVQMGS